MPSFAAGGLIGLLLVLLVVNVVGLVRDDEPGRSPIMTEHCTGKHWAKGETNYDPRKDTNHNGISC